MSAQAEKGEAVRFPEAARAAELIVRRAFEGRDGHGGKGTGIGKRVMTREELAVWAQAAFEIGVEWALADVRRAALAVAEGAK